MDVVKSQEEFIAAKPTGETVIAENASDNIRNRPENLISILMAEGVIDMLEIIDIHHRDDSVLHIAFETFLDVGFDI